MKNVAVLTSGTDNCGLNATIRSVVRTAIAKGSKVFGVHWGFRGLVEDRLAVMTSRSVSGCIGKAGSILGTAKPRGAIDTEADMKRVLYNLNKNSISSVVIIGGSESMKTADKLAKRGVQVIGVPATLQDDIPGIDMALGVDSAVNNIMECMDHIRSCDNSRNRTFLIEVEGTHCGSLATRAAIVSGAEMCLIPEVPCTDVDALAEKMSRVVNKGKTQCLTIVSRGWKPGIDALSEALSKREAETDLLVRKTILGYVQRGGNPSAYDRLLGTELGHAAVEALHEGLTAHIVGKSNGKIMRIPFENIINKQKEIDPIFMDMFDATSSN